MDAFLMAIEMGADGIESDVVHTKDNDLVFFHDYFIKFNDRKVRPIRLSMDQLKMIDLDKQRRKIPSIDEIFSLFKDKKNNSGDLISFSLDIANLKTGLLLIEKAKTYDMEQRIQITFDDYRWDKIFRKRSDKIILVDSAKINRWKKYSGRIFYKNYEKLKKYNIKAINLKAEDYKDAYKQEIEENGFDLYIWNCHEEQVIKKFIEKGVSAIYTNFPDVALKIKRIIQGG